MRKASMSIPQLGQPRGSRWDLLASSSLGTQGNTCHLVPTREAEAGALAQTQM